MAQRSVAVAVRDGDTVRFALRRPGEWADAPQFYDEDDLLRQARTLASSLHIADYSLIADSRISRLRAAGYSLVLLPPSDVTEEPLGVHAAFESARAQPAPAAALEREEIELLHPFLSERRRSSARSEALEREVSDLLRRNEPALHAAFAEGAALTAGTLRFLRAYPSLRTLRKASPQKVRYWLVENGFAHDTFLVGDILRMASGSDLESAAGGDLLETLIPSLIAEWELLTGRINAIDEHIYRTVTPAKAWRHRPRDIRQDPVEWSQRSGVPVHLSGGVAFDAGEMEPGADPADLVVHLLALRHGQPCQSQIAYGKLLRYGQSVTSEELGDHEILDLELIGQLLARDVLDAPAAARHGIAAREAWGRLRGSGVEASTLDSMERDLDLVEAMTAMTAIDEGTALALLHGILSDRADPPTAFTAEACGVYAVLWALWGDVEAASNAMDLAEGQLVAIGATDPGVIRAPLDLARLRVSMESASASDIPALRERADRSTAGTPYRSLFHFIVIFSTLVTGERELGVDHYHQLTLLRERHPLPQRGARLVDLAYAMLHASFGHFGAAKRLLDSVDAEGPVEFDTSEVYLRRLFRARLSLASGDNQAVLHATSPTGALSEQDLGTLAPRYLAGMLLVRGAALWNTGERQLAAQTFRRAIGQARLNGEVLTNLVCDSPAFRAWLRAASIEGADDQELLATVSHFADRPVLIESVAPVVTAQQQRILTLLATGRSAASIAAELSVTQNTMKTHLRALYRNLGVNSRQQAVTVGDELGLI